jgi:hypothetical protein
MRRMRSAADPAREEILELAEFDALDSAVEQAERGPLYFNLVVMVYRLWNKDYRSFLSSLGSIPSTPESTEEDEDLRSMLASP